jgi:hypothetical protein
LLTTPEAKKIAIGAEVMEKRLLVNHDPGLSASPMSWIM